MSCRQPTAVSEFLENNKPHCTQLQVTQTTEEGYFGMEDGGVSADWPKLGEGVAVLWPGSLCHRL